jgi:ubiquinone/menaquinone biosynthesis C-methylase UbiE
MAEPREAQGLLGDTVERNYSRKLQLFNNFAQREIRQAIASLALRPGMRVLDAGCGAGDSIGWFHDEVETEGVVVGMDLAAAHAAAARAKAPAGTLILQADLNKAPLATASVDLVWCVNTINHLRDPLAGLLILKRLLRQGGRIALAQSGLLPDMYFAWDSRLERVVNEAVRQYYRDRYRVDERELTAIRALVGLLRRAQLGNIQVRTLMIERVAPLQEADELYLREAIFDGTWGARLEPYLSAVDFEQLTRLCNPEHPEFALRRPDFHFLQTFTVAMGEGVGAAAVD